MTDRVQEMRRRLPKRLRASFDEAIKNITALELVVGAARETIENEGCEVWGNSVDATPRCNELTDPPFRCWYCKLELAVTALDTAQEKKEDGDGIV